MIYFLPYLVLGVSSSILKEEGHQAAPMQFLGNEVVAMVMVGFFSTTIQSNVTFAYPLVEVEGSSFYVLGFQFASSLHRACGFLPTAQMLETSILVHVWVWGGGEGGRERGGMITDYTPMLKSHVQKSHHSCQGGVGLSRVKGWSQFLSLL